MFVSKSMTRKVITIDKEDSIFEAQEKMVQHRIRHLPVVDKENQLIGIVTDRDIRSALPFSLFKDPASEMEKEKLSALMIKDIMTENPTTISPSYTIQDALLLIQKLRVGEESAVKCARTHHSRRKSFRQYDASCSSILKITKTGKGRRAHRGEEPLDD